MRAGSPTAQYRTILPTDRPSAQTNGPRVRARDVDASVVAAFVDGVRAAGCNACLLHTGAQSGGDPWQGDVDLLATGDGDAVLREVHAVAAALGFSPVLSVPRLFNTL